MTVPCACQGGGGCEKRSDLVVICRICWWMCCTVEHEQESGVRDGATVFG